MQHFEKIVLNLAQHNHCIWNHQPTQFGHLSHLYPLYPVSPTQEDQDDMTDSSQVSIFLSHEHSVFSPQMSLAVGTTLVTLVLHTLLYTGVLDSAR